MKSDGLTLLPGIALCLAIAVLALIIASLTAAPAVLLALLLGFLVQAAPGDIARSRGVAFSARTPLRLGIALIGVRLSLTEISAIGFPAIALGIGAVVITLAFGTLLGIALRLTRERSLLSAGAVGICGASAALAISAALPATPEREQETAYTIAAVTLLSTVAMLVYPAFAHWIRFDEVEAGLFFGAAIHDLAQVMGAGAMVSPHATEVAAVTKLIRVACLAPAAILIALAYRSDAQGERPPIVPWFIAMFVVAAVLANLSILPPNLVSILTNLSTLCLVLATAALGLKTSAASLLSAGIRPLLAAVAQTVMLAASALLAVVLIA
ncbi:MAG: YeiH family protein [Sphingomonas sp.]